MSDIDVESDDELKSRSTPLSRFGDFKQVKRLLAKGKRDLSGGLFTDRDRMALAMQSSSSLNKLNYLFRKVLWQTFMYQRRFVTPNESYSHRIPSGTLVIGIKGKRKGSYGLISGYDVVRKSYLVEWTVSGEKKHKKIKRFGQWFFVDGQGRRAKQNWIRVVTWGGIDTNTYLQSFLPNKNEALFQDNKSQWKCLRQERANIQKTFVEAGGPIDIPGRFHQNALFLLSSAQHQCEIFQCPHDAGDAITLLRLLSWGADPNVHLEIHGTSSEKPPFYGETPLLVAAKRGDLDCYRLLIMFGANKKYREYSETEKKRAELLSERYEGGPTPLSIAKKHWPLETISIMNSLEADNTTTSDKYIWDYSNCCYVKK
jgi:hypothetical protein